MRYLELKQKYVIVLALGLRRNQAKISIWKPQKEETMREKYQICI
jgi:hypothetical protein